MREIVTVQVGDFANYIGSHFWNFQDELLGLAEETNGDPIYKNPNLDMDVLYRAGETQQGNYTYTPRLVSIGLQGSLGSLCSYCSFYDDIPSTDPSIITTWTGNVSRHASERREKNPFLLSLDDEGQEKPTASANTAGEVGENHSTRSLDKDVVEYLENNVKFWTDYSKVQYHPRSLFESHGLWTDVEKFDNYGIGKDVFSGDLQEEMIERLRFFMEECDHIQGIQFIVDDSGGFSSVAADFLEDIVDEYANIPVLLYSARSPNSYFRAASQRESISRALHDAVSFSRLSSFSQLMIPIGLPSLKNSKLSTSLCIDDANLFHASAVYAAAIHSISLPFRMELLGPTTNSTHVSGAVDIGGLVQFLSGLGRLNKITALDFGMPAATLSGDQSQKSFLRSLHCLTPDTAENDQDLQAVESLVVHGARDSGGNRSQISEVKNLVNNAYQNEQGTPKFSRLSVALCPLPIPLPFPAIFQNTVGQHGELIDHPVEGSKSRGPLEIYSIPLAARLRSSSAILHFIEKRSGSLRRFGTERGAPGAQLLQSWGIGKEEAEDMGEVLANMGKAFDAQHSSSSDSE